MHVACVGSAVAVRAACSIWQNAGRGSVGSHAAGSFSDALWAQCLCVFFTPTGTLTHSARSQRHGEPRLCGYHHPRERFLFWNPTFKLGPRQLMMIIVPEHWFQPRLFAKPVSLSTFLLPGCEWLLKPVVQHRPGVVFSSFRKASPATMATFYARRWAVY